MAGRLAADRVDATVGAALSSPLHQFVVDIGFREIDGLRPAGFRHDQSLGHFIDRDDAPGSEQQCGADCKLSDRTAAPDRNGVSRFDLRIDGRHVAGRENVGQEQRLFVGDAIRNLDRAHVGHRDSEIFCLTAGVAPKHMAETEQTGRRLTHRLGRHLGVGIGAVAAGKQTLLAKPALPAADGEWHDDAVADLEVFDCGAQLDHLAHVLMAENVAALHGRLVAVKEMKVRAADGTGRYLDNCVAGMLDLRIRNRVYPDVAFSVPA